MHDIKCPLTGPPRRNSCLVLDILSLNLTPERLMQCPICSPDAAAPSDHTENIGALLFPIVGTKYVLTHVSFLNCLLLLLLLLFCIENVQAKTYDYVSTE